MKRMMTSLSLFATVLLPTAALADYTPQEVVFDPNNNVQRNTELGNASPSEVVGGVINWILGLLALIAISLVVYGGILWMTSVGNEEQVTKAKDILIGALIGLVIILASYGATLYVFQNLVRITE